MPNDSPCISRLHSGGLIVTYRCTSRCRHCLYASSPRRETRYIDETTARTVFRRIMELGCRSIHVGGGEPFMDPEALLSVLRIASAEGIAVEYIETNSSWCRDPEKADELLCRIRDLGVSTLLLSISPFHAEYVPYARVLALTDACRRTGLSVFPWIAELAPDLESLDADTTHTLEEFEAVLGRGYVRELPGRYWIHWGGRAVITFSPMEPAVSIERLRAQGGCRELADTSHFHCDLDGNYVPGLCSGLAVRVEDLGMPLDPERYPLIVRLHADGVRGLLDYAAGEHGFVAGPGYMNKCHLCLEIRRFLVLERGMRSLELRPAEFYREL